MATPACPIDDGFASSSAAVAKRRLKMPVDRVEDGLDVGDAAVALDREVRHVAARCSPICSNSLRPCLDVGRLLAGPRLEVVEQVELQEVDERGLAARRCRCRLRRRAAARSCRSGRRAPCPTA